MTVIQGDCLTVMPTLSDVDAIVCDPPYGLKFMSREWDHGVPGVPFWEAALGCVKPGAYLLAFGGTRTYHRLACAIEDAGWEMRDCLSWLYGSGFPKGKACLKPGWEPIILARKPGKSAHLQIDECRIGISEGDAEKIRNMGGFGRAGYQRTPGEALNLNKTPMPCQDFAQHPGGRWPANVVLSHTEDCREVGTRKVRTGTSGTAGRHGFGTDLVGGNHKPGTSLDPMTYADADGMETVTAWDCSPDCPVAMLDAQSGSSKSPARNTSYRRATDNAGYVMPKGSNRFREGAECEVVGYGDTGGASRFYYTAKASRKEREAGLEGMPQQDSGVMQDDSYKWEHDGKGNKINLRTRAANHHPTVKPLALMRWLCRLVTPPGGVILDPFMGSGSTGCAAALEGFRFIGIEREAEYVAIAEKRIAHWAATVQPDLLPAA